MWGLLCGHLVQFKAPKSWPNKFLINVWGGFSVIFIASYTANIAALIAGLFFHTAVGDHHDRSVSARNTYCKRMDRLLVLASRRVASRRLVHATLRYVTPRTYVYEEH